MIPSSIITLALLAISCTVVQAENATNVTNQLSNKFFPKNFLFGTATSAYQVEGAWNESGKGENIWDRYLHEHPDYVADGTNGDVAADAYHKWQEDVDILKQIGVDSYRFSISWSRLLPTGLPNSFNLEGFLYYNNLIKALKKNNIEPIVTLYHWDLPQALQELGGVLNPNFPQWFSDYAALCFNLFGSDVKYWFTFNEGTSFCVQYIFGTTLVAPGANASGIYEYQCSKSVLLAHASAWHIYDNYFRWQGGNVGMVIVSHWFQPASNSTADIEAAERALQFVFGWWAHPLIYGDYPPVMKVQIARRSREQGFVRSRLPKLSREEISFIKGTLDVLGLNIYTAFLVTTSNVTNTVSWRADVEATYYQDPSWSDFGIPGLKVAPWSARYLPKWIKNNYKNPIILITESGYGSVANPINDVNRTIYLQTYLSNVRTGMIEDGSRIIGYTYWSFVDTFEWLSGEGQNFGLVQVDFNSTEKTRTMKDSAKYYAKVARTKCLVDICEI